MIDIHHVSQFVQYFIDLLAVCEANVGLAHQTPHFLPDVIFVHLKQEKQTFLIYGSKNVKTVKKLVI